jgi:hypothetical protein
MNDIINFDLYITYTNAVILHEMITKIILSCYISMHYKIIMTLVISTIQIPDVYIIL